MKEESLQKAEYKKINAITTLQESEFEITTDLKTIEDYYDYENNYYS
ncbi:hypothetical protein [Chengkuizengella marina]|nr:hypothetical protein [Chengkuizengella marina]